MFSKMIELQFAHIRVINVNYLFLFQFYVRVQKSIASLFKTMPDWGGPHICHKTLDRLACYCNDGILQTVVDQVYTTDEAEKAIAHICSPKAIGGTIITFRS